MSNYSVKINEPVSFEDYSGLVHKRVIWSEVIEKVANEILPWYRAKGIVPGVREIYYRSLDSIPNNKSSYNQLSDHLVDARMSGVIACGDIGDETRFVYRDNIQEFTTPEDYLHLGKDHLS